MITPTELRNLCEAAYGTHWQTEIAKDIRDLTGDPLRSILRTISGWASGTSKPSSASETAIRLLTRKNIP